MAPPAAPGWLLEEVHELHLLEVELTSSVPSIEGAPPPAPAMPASAPGAGLELRDLVREHGDAVFRVALSIVRQRQLAEDVTQECFLKAWMSLSTYRGDAPVRHWILRIAHNTAISALRRRTEEPSDPALLPEAHTRPGKGRHQAPHPTPELIVEGRAALGQFEIALSQLDELSRSIVVLRDVEGLSYDEVATLLGVPMPTVKTRLLRARRVLAASLQDWRD